jgi:hypothetical protein
VIERIDILETIRKRRARLGGFVLAFFALASVATSAAPCFAMAVAHADSPAEHAVAHSGSLPAAGHDSLHAAGHDQSHLAAHDGFTPPDGSSDPRNHCPHCPLAPSMPGHGPDATHSFCSVVDDASDVAQPSGSYLVPKYVPLTPIFELPPPSLLRPPGIRASRVLAPTISSIALNLRHCVFLI